MSFRRCSIACACALGLISSLQVVHAENISNALTGFASLKTAVALKKSVTKGKLPRLRCDDPATRPIALGAYYFNNGDSAPGSMSAVSSFKPRQDVHQRCG